MDKATVDLITGLAHALAWPVTVLVVVLSLRSKIGELLLRLRSFEHGDTRVDFQNELRSISNTTDVPAIAERSSHDDDWASSLKSLATTAPRQSVLNAWNQLMEAVVGVAHENSLSLSEQELKTPKLLAERLRKQRIIDAQTCDAIVSMRLLRNKVAHAENMPVSTRDALAFIDMVSALMKNLDQSRNSPAPSGTDES